MSRSSKNGYWAIGLSLAAAALLAAMGIALLRIERWPPPGDSRQVKAAIFGTDLHGGFTGAVEAKGMVIDIDARENLFGLLLRHRSNRPGIPFAQIQLGRNEMTEQHIPLVHPLNPLILVNLTERQFEMIKRHGLPDELAAELVKAAAAHEPAGGQASTWGLARVISEQEVESFFAANAEPGSLGDAK